MPLNTTAAYVSGATAKCAVFPACARAVSNGAPHDLMAPLAAEALATAAKGRPCLCRIPETKAILGVPSQKSPRNGTMPFRPTPPPEASGLGEWPHDRLIAPNNDKFAERSA
jgi:hypothetical protein